MIQITCGRTIERQSDIALTMGEDGGQIYLIGYSTTQNGTHFGDDEVFRIRVDEDRLTEWKQYYERLKIHL